MDYGSRPLSGFLSDIASTDVAPAGGTAAAVVGAIGTACCEMVCIHLQRADVATDADLEAVRSDLEDGRARMLELGAADAEVVEALFGTSDADADRSTAKRSVGVPLSLAEACLATLESAAVVTGAAERPVVADAGTGAYFARSALQAAVFTARRNLDAVDDDAFREQSERRAAELRAAGDRAFERAMANLDGDA